MRGNWNKQIFMILTRKYLLGNILSNRPVVFYKLCIDFIWQRECKTLIINQEGVWLGENVPLDQVFFVLVLFLTLVAFRHYCEKTKKH